MEARRRIRVRRGRGGKARRKLLGGWGVVAVAMVAITSAVAGAALMLESAPEEEAGRRTRLVQEDSPRPPATGPAPLRPAPSPQAARTFEERPGPGAGAPASTTAHADRQGAIRVESPRRGQTVYSPLTVSGRANVFEAWVGIEVLDESGRKLASTFTTATCGSGCWGRFSKQVGYKVERDQDGMVRVFDDDADGDGRAQHEVRIPVQLRASISGVCWPTTRRELDRLQAAVNRGHQPWRLDPVSVARQCLLTLGVENPEMGVYQPTNQLRGRVTYRAGEQGMVFLRRLTPRSIFFVVDIQSCCAA